MANAINYANDEMIDATFKSKELIRVLKLKDDRGEYKVLAFLLTMLDQMAQTNDSDRRQRLHETLCSTLRNTQD